MCSGGTIFTKKYLTKRNRAPRVKKNQETAGKDKISQRNKGKKKKRGAGKGPRPEKPGREKERQAPQTEPKRKERDKTEWRRQAQVAIPACLIPTGRWQAGDPAGRISRQESNKGTQSKERKRRTEQKGQQRAKGPAEGTATSDKIIKVCKERRHRQSRQKKEET